MTRFHLAATGVAGLALLISACSKALAPAPSGASTSPRPSASIGASAQPSADGSSGKLAYVQRGDIWVDRVPSEQPRPITSSHRARRPAWSHDGHWLAYLDGDSQEESLWILNMETTGARPLKLGDSPIAFAWSPAADELAYMATAGSGSGTSQELFVFDARPEVSVASPARIAGGEVEDLAWSQDGHSLAFVEVTADPSQTGSVPNRTTRVLSWRNGAEPVQLFTLSHPAGVPGDGLELTAWPSSNALLGQIDPQFSASLAMDGLPLQAFSASGEAKPVTGPVLQWGDYVAVSPDGALAAAVTGAGRAAWHQKRIALVDLHSLTSSPLTGPNVSAASPAWSPDGSRIAYAAGPDNGPIAGGDDAKMILRQRRIWSMRMDGADVRQLTSDDRYRDERPIWSADGKHLLFARMDVSDQASLWVMDADGGNAKPVISQLTPSPDSFGTFGHVDWSDWFDYWPGV